MNLQHIPAAQRYGHKEGWLDTKHHFSFDTYYDPQNVRFGALRVFNDDRIAPASGFETHPHREMEIVTILLEGELEHRDSTGGHALMRAGDVQRMTAGTGVAHSEKNPNPRTATHLFQIWVLPETPRLAPEYVQQRFDPAERRGKIVRVVAKNPASGELSIHADADFYLGSLEPSQKTVFEPRPGRRQYVFVYGGDLSLGDQHLDENDQARITEATRLDLAAGAGGADFVLIDLG